MGITLVRIRVEMRRGEDTAGIFNQPPCATAGADMMLTEEMLAMKMPREIAARLLLSRIFEETLTKVAEDV